MNYSLDTAEDLLLVTVHVDTSAALALELVERVAAAGASIDARGYLVDMRATRDTASSLADYDLAYHDLEAAGMPRSARIALLLDEVDDSRSFFVTVALNAGYSLQVFHDEQAALSWLRQAPKW